MNSFGIGGGAPVISLGNTEYDTITILFGVLAAVSLAFCVRVAIKERKPWPVFLWIGGGLACYYETLTDVLGRCAWAAPGALPGVEAFGRHLPLFATFCYLFYFPVAQTLVTRALERGTTYRQWLRWYAVLVPIAFVFELYPVSRNWWFYYGDGQPLAIGGLPMYWSFCAMTAVTCSAALLHLLRQRIPGRWNALLYVPGIPLATVGVHMTVVVPVHAGLSSSTSLAVTTPLALVTIALACGMYALVGRLVTTDARQSVAAPASTRADRVVSGPVTA